MTANLYAALVRAQAAVRPVEKDSTNSFHKYKYASGDDVIASARAALNAHGLAAFALRWHVTEAPTWYIDWQPDPTDPTVDPKAKRHLPVKVEDIAIRLSVHFRLVHESGEALDFDPFGVPVLPEKGRPIDKAEAGARTYALSYFLRDLLLIPRVDEGSDVDQRDDRDRSGRATAPRPAAVPAPKPAVAPPAPAAPPPPAADPKRAEADAAYAKTIAAWPAHESEINAAVERASTAADALTILRNLYSRFQREAPRLPQRTPDEAATVQRLRDTIAQFDTDGLAEAAAQAREIVSEYGGLDGCTGADLPALVSQVDALATSVRAGKAA